MVRPFQIVLVNDVERQATLSYLRARAAPTERTFVIWVVRGCRMVMS